MERMPALLLRKRFAEASRLINDSDLLLFRRRPCSVRSPGSLISKAIATSGRSDYTHAAKAVWWHAAKAVWWRCNSPVVLLCVEVREFYGGRAVTLESQVRDNPGLIDVYAANDAGCREYSRFSAAAYMLSFAGQPYGYRAIARAAGAYLPFVRLGYQTDTDDTSIDDGAVFCSEAVSRADRLGGGIDPVPNLADRDTEPGDLARSDFYRYQFTLEP
jgi:hypothetical protein